MPSPSERDRMDQANKALRENFTEEQLKDLFVMPQSEPEFVPVDGEVDLAPFDSSRATFARIVDAPQMHDVALWVYAAGDDTPYTFQSLTDALSAQLKAQAPVHRGDWQGMDVSKSQLHATHELLNYSICYTPPHSIESLRFDVKPDLPWADEHFAERVGGEPLNPAPSYVNWPHHKGDKDRHITNKVFDHTYPERFWPKRANAGPGLISPRVPFNRGVRFEYGDLNDVVNQLIANPLTRQAYLPVWFPEDTGATAGQRVPCTLGYQFMCDADLRLHVWYTMRSCDFVRHFRNDVYFAVRLLFWVHERVSFEVDAPITPGRLNMNIANLHMFVGDAK